VPVTGRDPPFDFPEIKKPVRNLDPTPFQVKDIPTPRFLRPRNHIRSTHASRKPTTGQTLEAARITYHTTSTPSFFKTERKRTAPSFKPPGIKADHLEVRTSLSYIPKKGHLKRAQLTISWSHSRSDLSYSKILHSRQQNVRLRHRRCFRFFSPCRCRPNRSTGSAVRMGHRLPRAVRHL